MKYTLQVPEYSIDNKGIEKMTGKMLLQFPESIEYIPISTKYDNYRNANIHQLENGKILIEWL